MTLISIYLHEEMLQHLIKNNLLTEKEAEIMIGKAKERAEIMDKRLAKARAVSKDSEAWKKFIKKRHEEETGDLDDIYAELYKNL